MANDIHVSVENGRLLTRTPYNPDFPAGAKRLGGRWDAASRVWAFDARDEERVRALVREHYGTDGSEPVTLVTLRCRADQLSCNQDLWVAGRKVAYRPNRDDYVRLGDGCIIVEGGFPSSGGSVKNPRLSPKSGTVIEVRDIPAALAKDQLIEGIVWIVGEDKTTEKRVELETRKAQLLAQLAEVEAELKALDTPVGAPTALDRIASGDTP
jgi:hypothetical protein